VRGQVSFRDLPSSALRRRLLLESWPVPDLNAPILDRYEPLRSKAGQVPGHNFSDCPQARSKLLMGDGEIEGVGSRFFRSVQQQTRQPLRDTAEGHRLDQAHKVPQPASDNSQNFQSNVGVLAADLLEVALVDEQGHYRLHCAHRRWVWAAIEQGQLSYRSGRGLDGKHDLAPAWRCPKDLHAALNDEKDPGTFLSFPEKYFIGRKPLLDCPLGKSLKFVLGEGGEESDF
jgi:hypothetical protein